MTTSLWAAGERGLSRRDLLQRGAATVAVAGIPGILSACGDDDEDASGGDAGASQKVGGTLDYLGWEGEDFPELLADWKRKNGVQVKSSYIGSMSDIPPKFQAGGGGGIDVINYSSNGTARLLGSGVPFAPLDVERLPNRRGLVDFFGSDPEKNFVNDEGEVIAVPLLWGAMGISYNANEVREPTAWEELLEPGFKGKITILDDPSTCFGVAAALLDFDPAQMTQDQFEETGDYLRRVVGQAKQVTASFGDMATLLASGEVVAAWAGYPPVDAFAADAGNKNIRTNIDLEEGSASFSECYAINAEADNPGTAYAMINTLLEIKLAAQAADAILLPPTLTAALKQTSKDITSAYPADLDEFLARAPMVKDAPAQSDEFVSFGEVTEAWNAIKSGG
jgi:spermidine/putrescine-binding protein